MKTLENDFIKFWIEDGILYSEFKKVTNVSLEQIRTLINLRTEISENKNQYWCFNFKNLKSFDKDARDYSEKYGQEHLNACAAVLDSHVSKFIMNTFIKLKKPVVPLKGFSNKEEAITWLNEIKSKNEQF